VKMSTKPQISGCEMHRFSVPHFRFCATHRSQSLRQQSRSMAPHSKKHQAALARSPFEDPACLRFIHDFLCAGHYAFVAPVSKLWKQSYEATPSLKTIGFGVMHKKLSFLCDSKTTLYNSTVTSPSRLRLAVDSELQELRASNVKASLRLTCYLGIAVGGFAELDVLNETLFVSIAHPGLLCDGAALAGDVGKL
jgi:hypothetical protein